MENQRRIFFSGRVGDLFPSLPDVWGYPRLSPVFMRLENGEAGIERRINSEYATILRMARRPDRRGDNDDILSKNDLKQMGEGLSRLSVDAVRQAYHSAYARCRMVNDRVPSARSIQELVQVWKQLWKWR